MANAEARKNYLVYTQSDTVLVERQQLQSLEQALGAETVVEIAELFVSEARTSVTVITEAFEHNSLAQIASTAHALKSSAGTLGCAILADIFKEMELQAKSEQTAELGALVSCVQDLLEDSLRQLMQRVEAL